MVDTLKITIDSTIAPKLREWFKAGRGVRVWENQDLSSGRVGHQQYTPGDIVTAPHWSMADRGTVNPEDITIETFTIRARFRGMAKRRYWGMDVSDATRAKADRLTRKDIGEVWVYTIGYDYGRTFADVQIGTMVKIDFSIDAPKAL